MTLRIKYIRRVAATQAIMTATYLLMLADQSGKTIEDRDFKLNNMKKFIDQLLYRPLNFILYQLSVIYQVSMKVQRDYQEMVIELHNLKKLCNSEKLSHEATINQLQTSYNLNQQLQQVIKSQSQTISSLHRQIGQKTVRLNEVVQHYEAQIIELKQFVNMKDTELQGIRASLAVTDYQMIRLRIINELELVHKQKIEEMGKQNDKLGKMIETLKQEKVIVEEKYSYLKQEFEKNHRKHEEQIQQKQQKFLKQLKKGMQKQQGERIERKRVEKSLQLVQKRYKILQERYEQQMNKAYRKQQVNTIFKEMPMKDSLSKDSNKIRQQQLQLLQKEREVVSWRKKYEKQCQTSGQQIKKLQQELKDLRSNTIAFEEHMKKLKQVEMQGEDLNLKLERKIKAMKQQYDCEVKKLKKQQEEQLTQIRRHMGRMQRQKENIGNVYNKKQASTEREIVGKLQEKVKELEEQRLNLKKQLKQKNQKIKNMPQNDRERRQKKHDNLEGYKIKLEQANKQIVSLLREKIQMKQQINQLQKSV